MQLLPLAAVEANPSTQTESRVQAEVEAETEAETEAEAEVKVEAEVEAVSVPVARRFRREVEEQGHTAGAEGERRGREQEAGLQRDGAGGV